MEISEAAVRAAASHLDELRYYPREVWYFVFEGLCMSVERAIRKGDYTREKYRAYVGQATRRHVALAVRGEKVSESKGGMVYQTYKPRSFGTAWNGYTAREAPRCFHAGQIGPEGDDFLEETLVDNVEPWMMAAGVGV